MSAVFITGTDTDVGKTLVSAWLVRHWQAAFWKPVQAGPQTDSQSVRSLVPTARIIPSLWSLSRPLSPHLAADLDGVDIDITGVKRPPIDGPLVIEGAGGVFAPLNRTTYILDLISTLEAPAIVVARSALGTINHTLLTLHALRSRAIPILGVVMNGPLNPDNRQAIEHFGQIPVLAEIPQLDTLTPDSLAALSCPIPPP